MKKAFLTLLFLGIVTAMSAQILQFELDGTVFQEGETIVCTNDEYGYGELIQHMQIRNLTSDNLSVFVGKEVVEDLDGTMNNFCWGSCFGFDTYLSPNPVRVSANSLNTDELSFHVIFGEELFGRVVMRYFAYEENNPNDRITIEVIFFKSNSGVDETPSVQFGQAYPNPATSQVHFDIQGANDDVNVVVYNLLGQEVKSQLVNSRQSRINISVNDLQPGIYFCSFQVNNEVVKTEKFIVKR